MRFLFALSTATAACAKTCANSENHNISQRACSRTDLRRTRTRVTVGGGQPSQLSLDPQVRVKVPGLFRNSVAGPSPVFIGPGPGTRRDPLTLAFRMNFDWFLCTISLAALATIARCESSESDEADVLGDDSTVVLVYTNATACAKKCPTECARSELHYYCEDHYRSARRQLMFPSDNYAAQISYWLSTLVCLITIYMLLIYVFPYVMSL
ncbi:hypothetical protein AAVH_17446 [Aphelenchoides avenae]|nr:hypothetical protein AAVH_17446 [Aphelenchus avenae]